jgi:hypothetical protein
MLKRKWVRMFQCHCSCPLFIRPQPSHVCGRDLRTCEKNDRRKKEEEKKEEISSEGIFPEQITERKIKEWLKELKDSLFAKADREGEDGGLEDTKRWQSLEEEESVL